MVLRGQQSRLTFISLFTLVPLSNDALCCQNYWSTNYTQIVVEETIFKDQIKCHQWKNVTISRFSFLTGGSSLAMFVLLTEYVGKRHRHAIGTTLWYFWVLSLMLLALFAYFIRDWRTLSIAGAAPGLLQIIFWWWANDRFYKVSISFSFISGHSTTVSLLRSIDRVKKSPFSGHWLEPTN